MFLVLQQDVKAISSVQLGDRSRRRTQHADRRCVGRDRLFQTLGSSQTHFAGNINILIGNMGLAIIGLVFLPLFLLPGMEGRLMKPLGLAYGNDVVVSAVVDLEVRQQLGEVHRGAAEELQSHLIHQSRAFGQGLNEGLVQESHTGEVPDGVLERILHHASNEGPEEIRGAEELDDGDVELSSADRWIRARFDETVASAHRNFDGYRLDLVAQAVYEFTWHEFCDWYLELSKPVLQSESSSTEAQRGTRTLGIEPARIGHDAAIVLLVAGAGTRRVVIGGTDEAEAETVWPGGIIPFIEVAQGIAAYYAGVKKERVTIHSCFLGGGFGRRAAHVQRRAGGT